MRISDWSSDRVLFRSGHGAASRAPRFGAAHGATLPHSSNRDRGRTGHALYGRYAQQADPPSPEPPVQLAHGRRQSGPAAPMPRLAGDRATEADVEIGRAAGRERVGEYGAISGVAG